MTHWTFKWVNASRSIHTYVWVFLFFCSIDIRFAPTYGEQKVDNSRAWGLHTDGPIVPVLCNTKVKSFAHTHVLCMLESLSLKNIPLLIIVSLNHFSNHYFRTFYSGGAWHRPQNTHAALLDKYWSKLQIGNMTREELKQARCRFRKNVLFVYALYSTFFILSNSLQVLLKRYPNLAVVVDRLLDIYCQLTGDRHQVSSCLQGPSAPQRISDEHAITLEGRGLSLRWETLLM